MGTRFVVRLLFDWGGGCLWCGNEATRAAFGVGPVEHRLPISPITQQRLAELSAWHDKALDWSNGTGPSPWSPQEREQFEQAARQTLAVVRSELGPEFAVEYVPL